MKTKTDTLVAINLEKANRKQLEKYIKQNISFYHFVDLCGHSDGQLREVIRRNEVK